MDSHPPYDYGLWLNIPYWHGFGGSTLPLACPRPDTRDGRRSRGLCIGTSTSWTTIRGGKHTCELCDVGHDHARCTGERRILPEVSFRGEEGEVPWLECRRARQDEADSTNRARVVGQVDAHRCLGAIRIWWDHCGGVLPRRSCWAVFGALHYGWCIRWLWNRYDNSAIDSSDVVTKDRQEPRVLR